MNDRQITSQYRQLSALAGAWMSAGASSFSIWRKDHLLAHWPSDRPPQHPSLIAPIYDSEELVGDLRVAGIYGREAQARLTAEASLLAEILRQEATLDEMAAALVVAQEQMLALYGIAQSMRGHVMLEDSLRCLAFEAQRAVGAEHCFIILLSNAAAPTLVQYPEPGIEEDVIWELFWETHSGDRPIVVGPTDGVLSDSIRGLMLIPLRPNNQVSGAVGLVNRTRGEFMAADLKLAQAIIALGSGQVENAILHRKAVEQAQLNAEMALARRVQMSLLPQQITTVQGLDFFALTRPALQVGGDFYDLIYRRDWPLAFAVGDVSGKGVSAALLMTMARTAIRSKASYLPDPAPDLIMRQSSEDLYDDFARVNMLATLIVGQYDRQAQQITYANAGHSPVIYRPRDGAARLLQADSPAMGVLHISQCRNHTVRMAPGDLLLIGTDGFSDARNPAGESFGNDRLLQLVEHMSELPARSIADAVFEAADRFEDGRLRADDQTLVVIKGALE